MASLAGMLRERQYVVSGSDSDVYPPMSDFLDRLGILVHKGYRQENIQNDNPDLVVIGNALSRGNPEIEFVLDAGIRYASMAETVKELFIRGKKSVVVAGTHGKTTTTAMLSWMLDVAGRKPSFLVGGIAENFGRSFQVSDGSEFVIEGDEYDTAFFDKGPKFLHYLPNILVLKNIEFDHADIYSDLEALKIAFRRLINIVPRSGLIVAGVDSPVVAELIPAAFSRVVKAGIGVGDWQATNITPADDGMGFDLVEGTRLVGRFSTPLMGTFNVQNALHAVLVCRELGIEDDVAGSSMVFASTMTSLITRRPYTRRSRLFVKDTRRIAFGPCSSRDRRPAGGGCSSRPSSSHSIRRTKSSLRECSVHRNFLWSRRYLRIASSTVSAAGADWRTLSIRLKRSSVTSPRTVARATMWSSCPTAASTTFTTGFWKG